MAERTAAEMSAVELLDEQIDRLRLLGSPEAASAIASLLDARRDWREIEAVEGCALVSMPAVRIHLGE